MNATVKTNAFKSGNSVAVRLPKAFGIKAGDPLDVLNKGQKIEIRRSVDPEYARQQLAEMVRELREIGPIDGDPQDGRIEFPDRPGLY